MFQSMMECGFMFTYVYETADGQNCANIKITLKQIKLLKLIDTDYKLKYFNKLHILKAGESFL